MISGEINNIVNFLEEHTDSPRIIKKWFSISYFVSHLNNVYHQWKYGLSHINFMTLILGRSTDARKTTILGLLGDTNFVEESSPEALVDELAEHDHEAVWNVIDEYSTILSKICRRDSYMASFPSRICRLFSKSSGSLRTRKSGKVVFENVKYNCLALIQPKVFSKYFTDYLVDLGFYPRHLFVYVHNSEYQERPPEQMKNDLDLSNLYPYIYNNSLLRQVRQKTSQDKVMIRFSPEALEAYNLSTNCIDKYKLPEVFKKKYKEHLWKLADATEISARIRAFIVWDVSRPFVVSEESVKYASEEIEDLLKRMEKYFPSRLTGAKNDPVPDFYDQIRDFLIQNGETMTIRDIYKQLNITPDVVKRTIEVMKDQEVIEIEDLGRRSKGITWIKS